MWRPPKNVDDGLMKWKVVLVEKIPGKVRKGQEVFGLTDTKKLCIYLRSDLEPQRMQQVFWHELIHAIFAAHGIDDENESHVDVISIGLLRLIERNPGLFA